MSQTVRDDSDESTTDRFYLPAVAARPDFGRVEAVLKDLLEGHGVVLVPDTYNK